MEDEERKKKVQAGKEMFKALQKKKARKKRRKAAPEAGGDDSDRPDSQLSGTDSADISVSSDIRSSLSYEESDQGSIFASDLSGDEGAVDISFHAKVELQNAADRITELEESLFGKQAAVDLLSQENDKLREQLGQLPLSGQSLDTSASATESDSSQNRGDMESVKKVHDLEVALSQRDDVIKQLSTNLEVITQSRDGLQDDYSTQAEQLTQQIHLQQGQLQQAGERLQEQMKQQGRSMESLQEAKDRIISLQNSLQEKELTLKLLTSKFTDKVEELMNTQEENEQLKKEVTEATAAVRELKTKSGASAEPGQADMEAAKAWSQLLQESAEIHEKEMEGVRSEMENLSGERERLLNLVSSLETKCADLSEQLSQSSKEHIAQLNELKTHLDSSLVDKDNVLRAQEEVVNVLQKQVEDLVSERDSLVKSHEEELRTLKANVVPGLEGVGLGGAEEEVVKTLQKQVEDLKLERDCLVKSHEAELATLKVKSTVPVLESVGVGDTQGDVVKTLQKQVEDLVSERGSLVKLHEEEVRTLKAEKGSPVLESVDMGDKVLSAQEDVVKTLQKQVENLLSERESLVKSHEEQLRGLKSEKVGPAFESVALGDEVLSVQEDVVLQSQVEGFLLEGDGLGQSHKQLSVQAESAGPVLENVQQHNSLPPEGNALTSEDVNVVDRSAELAKINDAVENRCLQLEDDVQSLETQCKEMESQKSVLEMKYVELQKHFEELNAEHEVVTERFASVEDRCQEMEAQNQQYEFKCNELSARCVDLETKYAMPESRLREMEGSEDMVDSVAKADLLGQEPEMVQGAGVSGQPAEGIEKEFADNFQDLQSQNAHLQSSCDTLQAQCDQIQRKCSDLEKMLSETEKERNVLEKKCADLDDEISELNVITSSLTADMSSKDELVAKLETRCKELTGKLSSKESMQIDPSVQQAGHNYGAELSQVKEELDLSKEQLRSLMMEISNQDELGRNLTEKLQAADRAFDTMKNEKDEEIERMRENVEELSAKIVDKDTRIEQLVQDVVEIERMRENVEELSTKIVDKDTKIELLVQDVESTQLLNGQMSERENELENVKAENAKSAETADKVTGLELELEEQRENAMHIESKIQDLCDEFERVSASAAEDRRRAKCLEAEVGTLKKERDRAVALKDEIVESMSAEVSGSGGEACEKQSQVNEKESELENIKAENTRLMETANKVTGLELELEEQRENAMHIESKIQNLCDEFERVSDSATEDRSRAKHLEAEVGTLKEERDRAVALKDEIVESMSAEVSGSKRDICEKQSQVNEKERELENIKAENAGLMETANKVIGLELELEEQRENAMHIESKIQNLYDELERVSASATEDRSRAKHLEAEVRTLREERDEAVAGKDQALESMSAEMSRLKEEACEKQSLLENLSQELSVSKKEQDMLLQNTQEKLSDHEQELSRLREEHDAKLSQIESSEISRLNEEIDEKQKQIEEMRRELMTAREESKGLLENLEQKLQESEDKVQNVSQENREMSVRLEEKERQIGGLEKEIVHLKEESTKAIAEKDQVVQHLSDQESKLTVQVAEAHKSITSLDDNLKAAQEINGKYEDMLKAVNSEVDRLSEVVTVKDALTAKLQRELEELQMLVTGKNEVLQQLEWERLSGEAASCKVQMEKLLEEVTALKEENAGLVKDKDEMIQNTSCDIERLEKEISLKERQVDQLNGEVASGRVHNEKLLEEVTALKEVNAGLVKDKDEMIQSTSCEIERLEKEVSFKEIQVEQLNGEAASGKVEIDRLLEEMAVIKESNAALVKEKNEKLTGTTLEVERLEQEVSLKKRRTEELGQEIEEVKAKYAKDFEQKNAEIASLTSAIDERTRKVSNYASKVERLEKELERQHQLALDQSQLKEGSKELSSRVLEKEKEVWSLQKALEDLREENSEVVSAKDLIVEDLTKDVDQLKIAVSERDQWIGAAQANMTHMQESYGSALTDKDRVIQDLSNEVTVLKADIQMKLEAIEKLGQELQAVQEECKSKVDEIEQLTGRNSLLKQEYDDIILQKDQDIRSLLEEVESGKDSLMKKEMEVVSKEAEAKGLTVELDAYKQQMEQLFEGQKLEVDHRNEIEKLSKEVIELKQAMQEKMSIIADEEAVVELLKNNVESSNKVLDERLNEIQKLTNEIQSLYLAVQEKDLAIVNHRQVIETLRNEKEALVAAFGQEQARSMNLASSLQQVQSQNQALSERLGNEQAQIQGYHVEIRTLQEHLNRSLGEITNAQAEIQKYKNEIKKLVAEKETEQFSQVEAGVGSPSSNADYEMRITDLTAERDSLMQQLQSIAVERDHYQKKSESAPREELDSESEDLMQLKRELDHYRHESSDILEQMSKLNESHQQEIGLLQEQGEVKDAEIGKMRTALEGWSKAYHNMRYNAEQLGNALQDRDNHIMQQNQQIQDLFAQIQDHEANVQSANQALQQLEQEKSHLTHQVKELGDQKSYFGDQVEKLENDNRALYVQLDRFGKEASSPRFHMQAEMYDTRIQHLIAEIKYQESRVEAAKKEQEKISQNLMAERSKVKANQEMVAALLKNTAEQKAQIKRLHQQVQVLKKEKDQLNSSLQSSESVAAALKLELEKNIRPIEASDKDTSIDDLQHTVNRMKIEKETTNAALQALEVERNHLRTELHRLNTKLEQLQTVGLQEPDMVEMINVERAAFLRLDSEDESLLGRSPAEEPFYFPECFVEEVSPMPSPRDSTRETVKKSGEMVHKEGAEIKLETEGVVSGDSPVSPLGDLAVELEAADSSPPAAPKYQDVSIVEEMIVPVEVAVTASEPDRYFMVIGPSQTIHRSVAGSDSSHPYAKGHMDQTSDGLAETKGVKTKLAHLDSLTLIENLGCEVEKLRQERAKLEEIIMTERAARVSEMVTSNAKVQLLLTDNDAYQQNLAKLRDLHMTALREKKEMERRMRGLEFEKSNALALRKEHKVEEMTKYRMLVENLGSEVEKLKQEKEGLASDTANQVARSVTSAVCSAAQGTILKDSLEAHELNMAKLKELLQESKREKAVLQSKVAHLEFDKRNAESILSADIRKEKTDSHKFRMLAESLSSELEKVRLQCCRLRDMSLHGQADKVVANVVSGAQLTVMNEDLEQHKGNLSQMKSILLQCRNENEKLRSKIRSMEFEKLNIISVLKGDIEKEKTVSSNFRTLIENVSMEMEKMKQQSRQQKEELELVIAKGVVDSVIGEAQISLQNADIEAYKLNIATLKSLLQAAKKEENLAERMATGHQLDKESTIAILKKDFERQTNVIEKFRRLAENLSAELEKVKYETRKKEKSYEESIASCVADGVIVGAHLELTVADLDAYRLNLAKLTQLLKEAEAAKRLTELRIDQVELEKDSTISAVEQELAGEKAKVAQLTTALESQQLEVENLRLRGAEMTSPGVAEDNIEKTVSPNVVPMSGDMTEQVIEMVQATSQPLNVEPDVEQSAVAVVLESSTSEVLTSALETVPRSEVKEVLFAEDVSSELQSAAPEGVVEHATESIVKQAAADLVETADPAQPEMCVSVEALEQENTILKERLLQFELEMKELQNCLEGAKGKAVGLSSERDSMQSQEASAEVAKLKMLLENLGMEYEKQKHHAAGKEESVNSVVAQLLSEGAVAVSQVQLQMSDLEAFKLNLAKMKDLLSQSEKEKNQLARSLEEEQRRRDGLLLDKDMKVSILTKHLEEEKAKLRMLVESLSSECEKLKRICSQKEEDGQRVLSDLVAEGVVLKSQLTLMEKDLNAYRLNLAKMKELLEEAEKDKRLLKLALEGEKRKHEGLSLEKESKMAILSRGSEAEIRKFRMLVENLSSECEKMKKEAVTKEESAQKVVSELFAEGVILSSQLRLTLQDNDAYKLNLAKMKSLLAESIKEGDRKGFLKESLIFSLKQDLAEQEAKSRELLVASQLDKEESESDVNRLVSDLDSKDEEISNLESEVETMKLERETLVANLGKINEELDGTRTNLGSEALQYKAKLASLEESFGALQEQNEALNRDFENTREELQLAREQLETSGLDKEDIMIKLKDTTSEVHFFKEENAKLHQELQNLKAGHDELVSSLREDINCLSGKLMQSEVRNVSLEESLRESKDAKDTMNLELQKLKVEHETLQTSSDVEASKGYVEQIGRLTEMLGEKTAELDVEVSKNDTMQAQLTDLTRSFEDLTKESLCKDEKITELELKLEDFSEQIRELYKQVNNYVAEANTLNTQVRDLKTEKESSEKAYKDEINRMQQHYKQGKEKIMQSYKAQKEELDSLSQQKEDFEQQLQILQGEKEGIAADLAEVTSTRDEYAATFSTLGKQTSRYAAEVERLEVELESLRSVLNNSAGDNSQKMQELITENGELQCKLKDLQSSHDKLESNCAEYLQSCNELQEESVTEKLEVEQLRGQVRQLMEDLNELKHVQDESEALGEKLGKMEEQLTEKEAEIGKLQTQLEDVANDEKKESELSSEVQTLRSQVDELSDTKRKNEVLVTEMDSIREQLSDLKNIKDDNDTLASHVNDLEEQLTEASLVQEEKDKLKEQMDVLLQICDKYKDNEATILKEKVEKENEVTQLTEEITQLNVRLEQLGKDKETGNKEETEKKSLGEESLKQELEENKSKLTILEQENKDWEDIAHGLKQVCAGLREENQGLKQSLDESAAHISRLEATVRDFEKEIDHAQSQFTVEIQKMKDKIKTETESLQVGYDHALENAKHAMESDKEASQDAMVDVLKEHRQEVDKLQEELDKLKTEFETKATEYKSLEVSSSDLQVQKSKMVEDMITSREELNALRQKYERDLQAAVERCDEAMTENRQLQENYADLGGLIEKMKSKHDEELKSIEEELKTKYEIEKEQTTEKLKKYEVEFAKLSAGEQSSVVPEDVYILRSEHEQYTADQKANYEAVVSGYDAALSNLQQQHSEEIARLKTETDEVIAELSEQLGSKADSIEKENGTASLVKEESNSLGDDAAVGAKSSPVREPTVNDINLLSEIMLAELEKTDQQSLPVMGPPLPGDELQHVGSSLAREIEATEQEYMQTVEEHIEPSSEQTAETEPQILQLEGSTLASEVEAAGNEHMFLQNMSVEPDETSTGLKAQTEPSLLTSEKLSPEPEFELGDTVDEVKPAVEEEILPDYEVEVQMSQFVPELESSSFQGSFVVEDAPMSHIEDTVATSAVGTFQATAELSSKDEGHSDDTDLQEELRKAEKELAKLKRYVAELEERLNGSGDFSEMSDQKFVSLTQELQDLRDECSTLLEDQESLKFKYEQDIKNLQNDHNTELQTLKDLVVEYEEAKQQQLDALNAQHLKELEDLTQNLTREKEEALETQRSDHLDELKQDMKQHQSELDEVQLELNIQTEEQKQTVAELSEEIEFLKGENQKLQAEIAKSQKELKELNEELEVFRNDVSNKEQLVLEQSHDEPVPCEKPQDSGEMNGQGSTEVVPVEHTSSTMIPETELQKRIKELEEKHTNELQRQKEYLKEIASIETAHLRAQIEFEMRADHLKHKEDLERQMKSEMKAFKREQEMKFIEELQKSRVEMIRKQENKIEEIRRKFQEQTLHQTSVESTDELEEVVQKLQQENQDLLETRLVLLEQLDQAFYLKEAQHEQIQNLATDKEHLEKTILSLRRKLEEYTGQSSIEKVMDLDKAEWRIRYNSLLTEQEDGVDGKSLEIEGKKPESLDPEKLPGERSSFIFDSPVLQNREGSFCLEESPTQIKQQDTFIAASDENLAQDDVFENSPEFVLESHEASPVGPIQVQSSPAMDNRLEDYMLMKTDVSNLSSGKEGDYICESLIQDERSGEYISESPTDIAKLRELVFKYATENKQLKDDIETIRKSSKMPDTSELSLEIQALAAENEVLKSKIKEPVFGDGENLHEMYSEVCEELRLLKMQLIERSSSLPDGKVEGFTKEQQVQVEELRGDGQDELSFMQEETWSPEPVCQNVETLSVDSKYQDLLTAKEELDLVISKQNIELLELEGLKRRCQKLDEENAESADEMATKDREFRQRVTELEEDILQFKTMAEGLEEENVELKKEVSLLRVEVGKLCDQNLNLQRDLDGFAALQEPANPDHIFWPIAGEALAIDEMDLGPSQESSVCSGLDVSSIEAAIMPTINEVPEHSFERFIPEGGPGKALPTLPSSVSVSFEESFARKKQSSPIDNVAKGREIPATDFEIQVVMVQTSSSPTDEYSEEQVDEPLQSDNVSGDSEDQKASEFSTPKAFQIPSFEESAEISELFLTPEPSSTLEDTFTTAMSGTPRSTDSGGKQSQGGHSDSTGELLTADCLPDFERSLTDKELSASLQKLSEECSTYKAKQQEIEERLSRSSTPVCILDTSPVPFIHEVKELNERISLLKDEKVELKALNQGLHEMVEQLKKKNGALVNRNDDLEMKNVNLEVESERLRVRIAELERELDKYFGNSDRLKKKNADLSLKCNRLESLLANRLSEMKRATPKDPPAWLNTEVKSPTMEKVEHEFVPPVGASGIEVSLDSKGSLERKVEKGQGDRETPVRRSLSLDKLGATPLLIEQDDKFKSTERWVSEHSLDSPVEERVIEIPPLIMITPEGSAKSHLESAQEKYQQDMSRIEDNLDQLEKKLSVEGGAGSKTSQEGESPRAKKLSPERSRFYDELSQLRMVLKETKDAYVKENSLLKEALEHEIHSHVSERSLNASASSIGARVVSPRSDMAPHYEFPTDYLALREKLIQIQNCNQEVIGQNHDLSRRLREQERMVLELKDHLDTSDIVTSEVQQVFTHQLAMLQTQRDFLEKKVQEQRGKEAELASVMGDKLILQENLRREKELLRYKVHEKERLEIELSRSKARLEERERDHRRLQHLLQEKDRLESDLVRQKRTLQDELSSIEGSLISKSGRLKQEREHVMHEWCASRSLLDLPSSRSSQYQTSTPQKGHMRSATDETVHSATDDWDYQHSVHSTESVRSDREALRRLQRLRMESELQSDRTIEKLRNRYDTVRLNKEHSAEVIHWRHLRRPQNMYSSF